MMALDLVTVTDLFVPYLLALLFTDTDLMFLFYHYFT